jgi:peptidoglycan hydrolase-like protein with peptidoglycan-binding domain
VTDGAGVSHDGTFVLNLQGVQMRRSILGVLALLLAASGLAVLPASGAASTPVPFPAKPKGLKSPVTLPAAVDPVPAYVPQIACQPGTPGGVVKLRALVLKTYGVGGAGNTARTCTEGTSEHADGRAWDWMVNVKNAKEKAAAGDFLAWLTASEGRNARRLGIMYVIHNKKIWGAYRAKDGWRASSGHTDHIHVSFSWNGAHGTTSFWTGKVQPVEHGPCRVFAGQPAVLKWSARTTPCPGTLINLLRKHENGLAVIGTKGTAVGTAQGLLKVTKTKVFDNATWMAVRNYQNAHDLPMTGALDVPTWASLVPAKVTSDAAKGFTVDRAAAAGVKQYAGWTLKQGSAGRSSLLLQVALGMPAADRNGYYGAKTVAAVKKLQRSAGLPETGKASAAEWKALAAA